MWDKHERAHADTPYTNKHTLAVKMGNANSQMLENIVQGSNCESAAAEELYLQPREPEPLHRSKRTIH